MSAVDPTAPVLSQRRTDPVLHLPGGLSIRCPAWYALSFAEYLTIARWAGRRMSFARPLASKPSPVVGFKEADVESGRLPRGTGPLPARGDVDERDSRSDEGQGPRECDPLRARPGVLRRSRSDR